MQFRLSRAKRFSVNILFFITITPENGTTCTIFLSIVNSNILQSVNFFSKMPLKLPLRNPRSGSEIASSSSRKYRNKRKHTIFLLDCVFLFFFFKYDKCLQSKLVYSSTRGPHVPECNTGRCDRILIVRNPNEIKQYIITYRGWTR